MGDGRGRTYGYATQCVPEGQSDPPQGPKQGLQELFRGWHAPVEPLIEATEEAAILATMLMTARRYGAGRSAG